MQTDSVIAVTWFLNALGGVARIITTVKDLKGDPFVLFSFSASTLLNTTVLAQILYYKHFGKRLHKK
jgi:hypothetical protein